MSRTLKGILLAGTTGLCWGLTTLATKLIGFPAFFAGQIDVP